MTIDKWSSHPEYGTFRTLTYRAPVKKAIGPSTTRLEETQRYHLQKERLVTETVSVMHDIPYGDYFRVESMQEVVSLGPDRCKLTCYVGVNFTKKTFFEGKIKTGVLEETTESFKRWISLAEDEIKRRKSRRRSIIKTGGDKSEVPQVKPTTSSPTAAEPIEPPFQPRPSHPSPAIFSSSVLSQMVSKYIPPPMHFLMFILVVLLVILFIQNAQLSGRITELEQHVNSFCNSQQPLDTIQKAAKNEL